MRPFVRNHNHSFMKPPRRVTGDHMRIRKFQQYAEGWRIEAQWRLDNHIEKLENYYRNQYMERKNELENAYGEKIGFVGRRGKQIDALIKKGIDDYKKVWDKKLDDLKRELTGKYSLAAGPSTDVESLRGVLVKLEAENDSLFKKNEALEAQLKVLQSTMREGGFHVE